MDFKNLLKKKANGGAVWVEHPGDGSDPKAEFLIVPSDDANTIMATGRNLDWSELEVLTAKSPEERDAALKALGGTPREASRGLQAKLAAYLVKDWRNLSEGDKPLPYSRAKALELCSFEDEDGNMPFAEWVSEQASRLAAEKRQANESVEELKKSSPTT